MLNQHQHAIVGFEDEHSTSTCHACEDFRLRFDELMGLLGNLSWKNY